MGSTTNTEFLKLLPEFKRWVSIHKNSLENTSQKQVYILTLILKRYSQFCLETAEDWIIERKKVCEASTVEKDVHAIRVFGDFLVYKGILKENWARKIPIPKRDKIIPVVFTISEVEQLLNCRLNRCYSWYPDPERAEFTFNVIFGILAKTGCRLGEVLSIRLMDIDWTEGIWNLPHSKNGHGRLIPIPPDLLPKMDRLAKGRVPGDLLFWNEKSNGPIRHHQVESNFRRRLKECNIRKPAVVHTFRHSFITEMLRQDVSVLKIANIVGHENISTTQGYAKLLYEDMRDCMMRHPLVAKQRNPYDILKHVKEVFEHFHLREDPRFMVNVEEGNDGLRLSAFVR